MENFAYEIVETARTIRRAFDRRAAVLGTTRAQWRVLARLSHEDGARQVALAEALDVEPITLCRIVDRLEEAGWVERVRDPEDRRAWRLHVTAQAQPLIEKLQAVGAQLVDRAFSGIDPNDIEIARRVLADVRENAARSGPINRVSNE